MSTMAKMLRSAALQYGDRVAIKSADGELSYREYLERVRLGAGVLRGLGIRPGDRFGLLAPNRALTAELFFAGYWAGAVPVPVNFRLAPTEISHILDDAQVTHLFVDEGFRKVLDEEPLHNWRDGAIFLSDTGEEDTYRSLFERAIPAEMHRAAPNDDALLLYTGGTTGRGKGVRLSHRNILADALQNAPAFPPLPSDVYLHAAPMFHSADLLGTLWFLFGGAHVYLPAFTPAGFLETIERYGVTFTMLPPTMVIMALQSPDLTNRDLSSLRGLIYGASSMPVEWINRTIEALPGVALIQGYGLTETAPLLTVLSWEAHRDALDSGNLGRLKSCGRPITGVELRVVDDEGADRPVGEGGEVIARGANVMKGYLNRGEETLQALRDGWFHTGDVGRLDEEDFLYLLDRKKDMVVSGGENIYTAEVEAVLHQHPGVAEAAVIGVPDDTFGEALVAVIVTEAGSNLTPEEIIGHCRGKIGGYKIPRRIEQVEAMPKSALGKILKTELRKKFGDST